MVSDENLRLFLADSRRAGVIVCPMKNDPTLAGQRRWVEQWRQTALALDEVKRYELANLTEEQAWRQTEDLLSLPEIWRDPNAVCGLIEQQVFFQRGLKGE